LTSSTIASITTSAPSRAGSSVVQTIRGRFRPDEHARLLRKFAVHLDAIGAEYVTIEVALAWAGEPIVPAASVVPAMRLLAVRGFARYLAGIEPMT
jgi:hypothetical protein